MERYRCRGAGAKRLITIRWLTYVFGAFPLRIAQRFNAGSQSQEKSKSHTGRKKLVLFAKANWVAPFVPERDSVWCGCHGPSVETLGYCHLSQFEEPTVCDSEVRADNYGKRRAGHNAQQILVDTTTATSRRHRAIAVSANSYRARRSCAFPARSTTHPAPPESSQRHRRPRKRLDQRAPLLIPTPGRRARSTFR